jgi:hypothetical protein
VWLPSPKDKGREEKVQVQRIGGEMEQKVAYERSATGNWNPSKVGQRL